jgi:type IV secretory pathway TraG/TraD family ATPase VirD4
LFQSKIVFRGIGDIHTLETVSRLGGQIDVPHSSKTRPSTWAAVLGERGHTSHTESSRRDRRFPVEVIAQGAPNVVLHLDGVHPQWLRAVPWFANPELASIVDPNGRQRPAMDTAAPARQDPEHGRAWERSR